MQSTWIHKFSRNELQYNSLSYNNNVTLTISQHIQNPGILNTWDVLKNHKAYSEPWHNQSSLFRHFQACSETFSKIQSYSGILREIKGTLRHFWCIFSHTQTNSKVCITLTYTTVPHSELWHSQNNLFKYFQGNIGIFRDSDAYLATLTGAKLAGVGVMGKSPPSVLFWKS